jgi:hypothetical protein
MWGKDFSLECYLQVDNGISTSTVLRILIGTVFYKQVLRLPPSNLLFGTVTKSDLKFHH